MSKLHYAPEPSARQLWVTISRKYDLTVNITPLLRMYHIVCISVLTTAQTTKTRGNVHARVRSPAILTMLLPLAMANVNSSPCGVVG